MTTILVHPFSGLLSAYGMGLADIRASRQQALEGVFDETGLGDIADAGVRLGAEAAAEVAGQGVATDAITVFVRAHIRYAGTDTALEVEAGQIPFLPQEKEWAHGLQTLQSAFQRAHRQRFGFIDETKPLIIEAVSVEAIGGGAKFAEAEHEVLKRPLPAPAKRTRFFSGGHWHDASVYTRDQLFPGAAVTGPALIIEPNQTIVVEAGWRTEVTARDTLVLTRVVPLNRMMAVGTRADPVMLEVFNNLFMSIAEQMGLTLQNTAYSVNIKERLDFSCAVFEADGALCANAPHMPVHLGSMDESVKAIIRQNAVVNPGDVFVLNAPYNGGTHLPDITVCTPVFDKAGAELLFWVASRGHHADVGGVAPGSMSPRATHIEEEGVYIDNLKLVDRGRFLEDDIVRAFTTAKYPVRNLTQNMNDLKAQIASNARGQQELEKMVETFGLDVVKAYMSHVQDNAAEMVRRVLDRLHDCSFTYPMDQGCDIRVKITVDKTARRATVDFTGTSPQRADNFNAPMPVTRAAVLYVFRLMVDDEIPMNAGCLRPIDIIIPKQSMLSPEYPAAVVAGNVEVSQAVTNCLFGALEAMAASQGTMNNLTFGDDTYQYYETICSGSPAGPGWHGTSGVHVHMTNSRLTDPEILEFRFPVVLEDFHIRRGSGGKGQWNAGDGTKRTIRFLKTMECAILSAHRKVRPFGMAGGEPGELGRTEVRRLSGNVEVLEGADQTVLQAGEAVTVVTPTGGGYGRAG
jgi:5-oxoprolinase (ATP-hydrolysing)